MVLPIIPTPQRSIELVVDMNVDKNIPVILQMPQSDVRLVNLAEKIFENVHICSGEYALYSEGSFAPVYEMNRAEGYLLNIYEETVQVASKDARGLFYGLQTLQQYLAMPEQKAIEISDWPDLAIRSDYLDMRGLFPKFDRVLDFVKEMAFYKLNTLVVEYEDKLPRSRKEFCHPTETWSYDQLTLFWKAAYDNFIDIIPLQQSFGHLEYALKLPEYQYLRELPTVAGEICPLREGAAELTASLIEETVYLHPHSNYIHLGCDEVFSLGKSQECQSSNCSRSRLAIDFINKNIRKVISLGKKPIIWHDMLEKATDEELSLLDKQVIVGIWLYSPETVNAVAPDFMRRLHAQGISTLPCCSVRAFDQAPDQNYPCVEQRLRNIDSWCELIKHSRSNGMINTNWCSSFSFGNPYGLFETSRYTAFYAAERCWNLHANTSDFLERFLAVYHGIYQVNLFGGNERRYDYYKIIGDLLPKVRKNIQTAKLIDLMYRLEGTLSVNSNAFRGRMFPNSEVELTCLREKALKQYPKFYKTEKELKKLLPELLSSEMCELFMQSRIDRIHLQQKELEKMLGISLTF